LSEIIAQLEKDGAKSSKATEMMRIGVDTIPELSKDTTDRNRTSPFAFTGNKFEFRAVGSSQNCAGPNVVLNTIAAQAFDEIATKLEPVAGTDKFNETLQGILTKILTKHKRVVFNGDNYSEEWVAEAARRGLPNIISVPEALKSIVSKETIELCEKYEVLTEAELHSRYEVYKEEFEKLLKIEGLVGVNIAKTIIFPTAVKFQTELLKNIKLLSEMGISSGVSTAKEKTELIGDLLDDLSLKTKDLEKIVDTEDPEEIAVALANLRLTVDTFEKEVDDKIWPLPKYSEMLFIS